jgi:hypothetical protein
VNVKDFTKCCISNVMDKTDDDTLWNPVKRMGMTGVHVRKM